MNPLESRIHRDTTTAAAEITSADIPPLRLRNRRGRLPRQRRTASARSAVTGPPGSWGARRWLTPLAAAAGVAALVAVMVAVGNAHSTGHRIARPITPSARRGQARLGSEAQARLGSEALDSYFPATGAQYTAGLAFEWTRQKTLHRLLEPCLAHAGFPQPAFSWPKGQYMLSFPDNSQFPDLAQRARTRLMTPYGTGIGKGSGSQSRGYVAAVRRCTASNARAVTRLDRAAGPLASAWLPIITRVQSAARIRALQPAFSSCLEARGIPAAYAQSHSSASNYLFEGFFGWMDHLGMTDTNASQDIAHQHRWTPVFVHCARPTVTVMERLQLAQRARFFQRHARQISAIKTLAMDLPRSLS
jgi:hypothetical protein